MNTAMLPTVSRKSGEGACKMERDVRGVMVFSAQMSDSLFGSGRLAIVLTLRYKTVTYESRAGHRFHE